MTDEINDTPIVGFEEDKYGVTSFAKSMANSILSIKQAKGTTLALHGAWGSGKSSAVNLIRKELKEASDSNLVITEFTGWWFKGEEALTLAFLQNLDGVLNKSLGEKAKDLIPELGRSILQAGPVIGTALSMTPAGPFGALLGSTMSFAKRFFPNKDPIENTFNKLKNVLAESDKRFLVILDDIDRLEPTEALAVFRLIKTIGNLPNIIYLLVFDRALADETVAKHYPSEGPHFLEKIIQVAFELPMPIEADMNLNVLAAIDEICGPINEDDHVNIMNMYYDVVAPYILTPRHVTRFKNAIELTWPIIRNEVNVADFIGLETLKLYEPKLFEKIRRSKEDLTDRDSARDRPQNADDIFIPYFKGIDESRHPTVKAALQRIFPKMENVHYGGGFYEGWDEARRICVGKHFDTYFRLSLGEETISSQVIDELCERADDQDYIKEFMRNAATVQRKNGQSMIPVYFDAINSHAGKIAKDKVIPFLQALFEIHDEIDLDIDKDRGFYGIANTSLRYYWLIRRITDRRYDLDERTKLYKACIPFASIGWMVDFVSSARVDYMEREGRITREEDCLVNQDVLPELTEMALQKIRDTANAGELLDHQDLISIMYRWRDFCEDNTEVKKWADAQLDREDALVIFARAFTGESWSFGLGGFGALGDRVSHRTVIAQIDDKIEILDPKKFRKGLEALTYQNKLSEPAMSDVKQLLEAWDKRNAGER